MKLGKIHVDIVDTFDLKGQFNIDPVNGTAVHSLRVGDSVYCEIIDRKDVSVSVGRLIGAYKQGLWLPIKGRILEVTEAVGDRRRFNLILARGIYIDVLSFSDILVRTTELRPRERVREAQPNQDQSSSLPLLVAVVLLAALVMLADKSRISIAKFKSNMDYQRELARRCHAMPQLLDAFGRNVGVFEAVWYGTHEATARMIDGFIANQKTIGQMVADA